MKQKIIIVSITEFVINIYSFREFIEEEQELNKNNIKQNIEQNIFPNDFIIYFLILSHFQFVY
jgi:hypothetical protein